MNTLFGVTTKAALLQGKSSKILSSFHKTKEDLMKLNQDLDQGISEHEEQMAELKAQTDAMAVLKQQHQKVILNIDAFLNV